MSKITGEKTVTSPPDESEIFTYLSKLSNSTGKEDSVIRDAIAFRTGAFYLPIMDNPNFGDRSVLFRSNKYGLVEIYFRKCRGCGILFPTFDRRRFYHTRNCQTLSSFDSSSRRCKNCGKSLKGKNKSAKTCSNACRMAKSRHSEKS
jgi:hypothetical protein